MRWGLWGWTGGDLGQGEGVGVGGRVSGVR